MMSSGFLESYFTRIGHAGSPAADLRNVRWR
jgi:hypothetical protein